REAARHVMARRADLKASVVVAYFGAEEWGLQGSRFFAAHRMENLLPKVGACLNLDTVGDKAKADVHVIGESIYKGLGAMAKRCLTGAGLDAGRDIDRFAFPHGSDHWPLHVAGIPALDLFSGNYRSMNSKADVMGNVDAAKVSRLARAAAAFALGLSREGLPE
ncbi:MAG: M28 family metallopeptidase, partial [Planctomycetota bacterium]